MPDSPFHESFPIMTFFKSFYKQRRIDIVKKDADWLNVVMYRWSWKHGLYHREVTQHQWAEELNVFTSYRLTECPWFYEANHTFQKISIVHCIGIIGGICHKVSTLPGRWQVDFKPQIISNVKRISIKGMIEAGVGTRIRLRLEYEDLWLFRSVSVFQAAVHA